MTYEQVVVLLTLGGALTLFVTEALPLGVTGLCVIAALGISGVLGPEEALGAFSSPAVVLVGGLYVVSASLIRTGVVGVLDRRLLQIGSTGSERRLLVWATLGALLVSTVLNNTSVVVLMLPMLLGVANRIGVAPSRLLMPISFAAILGGTMTLIGTSTNILVADLADEVFTIRFFDFLPMGAGFATVGLLYLWFVAPRTLPSRPTISSVTRGRTFEYVSNLRVPESGPATNLTPAQLKRQVGDDIRILQLVRGEEILDRFSATEPLRPGDVLILRGSPEAIVALCRDLRLTAEAPEAGPEPRATTFAEIVITPASELIGRTLAQIGLKRKYGVVALALQRMGAHLRYGITHVPLRIGDVVLVQGPPRRVERLRGQAGFLLLVGVEENVMLRRRAPVAITILLLFIVAAALGGVSLPLLAVAAAAACMVSGCLPLRRAIQEIDFNVLGLLAGAVTLGLALQESGLAMNAAEVVLGATRALGPVAVLSAIYLLTAVATEFVSNSGAAALMVPIALATAAEAGHSPRPFVFAVAFAASAHGGPERLWFCFRLRNGKALQRTRGPMRLLLKHGESMLGWRGAEPVQPVIRYETGDWRRLPAGKPAPTPDGRAGAWWQIDAPDLYADVAACYPYGQAELNAMLHQVAPLAFVRDAFHHRHVIEERER